MTDTFYYFFFPVKMFLSLFETIRADEKKADIAGFRIGEARAGYSHCTLPALWALEFCSVLGCAAQRRYRDKVTWAAGN